MERDGGEVAEARAEDAADFEGNRRNRAAFRTHLGSDEERRQDPHRPTWLTPKSANASPRRAAAAPPHTKHAAHEPRREWDAARGVWRRVTPDAPSTAGGAAVVAWADGGHAAADQTP
eukprot:573786-Prymnesium_polylepis.1